MTIVVGIQARARSQRLPGKNFYMLGEKKICEWAVEQAKLYFPKSKIFLLVPDDEFSVLFSNIADQTHVGCIIGDEVDVLSRYEKLAMMRNCAAIVRWTSDNPMKCSEAMHLMQRQIAQTPGKYVAYSKLRKTAVEYIPSDLLLKIRNSDFYTDYCKEHVTLGLRDGSKLDTHLLDDNNLELHREIDQKLTIDTANDFVFVEQVIKGFNISPNSKAHLGMLNNIRL